MRQLAVANVEHRDIVIVQVAKDVEQEAEEVDPEGDELEPEFVLKGDLADYSCQEKNTNWLQPLTQLSLTSI